MRLTHKLIILGALAVALAQAGLADLKVGDRLPALDSYALDGATPQMANKVVLLDFCASWCAPCKESFPEYGKLQVELAARGFTVVAVSVDKQEKEYREFLRAMSPSFPVVRDGSFALASVVRPPAMPTCYVVDRRGIVRSVHTGFHGKGDIRALKEEIEQLLKE